MGEAYLPFHFFTIPDVSEKLTCRTECFPCHLHTATVKDIQKTEIYCTVIVSAWNSQPLPWRYTRGHICPHTDHYQCEVGCPATQTQKNPSTEDTERHENLPTHRQRPLTHKLCKCLFTLICLWIHTCVRVMSERGRESNSVNTSSSKGNFHKQQGLRQETGECHNGSECVNVQKEKNLIHYF